MKTHKKKIDYKKENIRLRSEIRDFNREFSFYYEANMDAIKMWQKKTGKDLTWPNKRDLVIFLLEEIEQLKKGINSNKD